MCGIAGTLDLQPGLPPADTLVAAMTDALAHRGPEDAGVIVDPPAVIGHRRRPIVDLTRAGRQPMVSEDGNLWITYNGEVYNYPELRRELRALGHTFRSTCDTEVLLAAFAEWGASALQRLNGPFAFAVWNRRTRELFCARDRLGIKPFYYTVAGGRFRFASEIKALLVDDAVRRVPNDDRVLEFLSKALLDHTDETLFEGIRQLPPGSYFTVSAREGVGRPVEWYRLEPTHVPERKAPEVFRELLEDAVAIRLRCDVPVGSAVSGGLDSTAVTMLANAVRKRDGHGPLATFTSRTVDPRIDEMRFVDSIVAATGSEHHSSYPDQGGIFDMLDDLLWYMDEPFHEGGVYGYWKLLQLASENGIIVLLDGQGGDEPLAGQHNYLYPALFFTLAGRGRFVRAASELRARKRVSGVGHRRSLSAAAKYALPEAMRTRRRPPWINPALPFPAQPLPGRTLDSNRLYSLRVSPLPLHCHEADRMSMSFALELRNPFLDYRLVELGRGRGPDQIVNRGRSKWVIREAMRGTVPDEIVDRGPKQGFSTDEGDWLRDRLGALVEETFRSESFRSRPYFLAGEVLAALDSHRLGQNRRREVWRAFIVERWLRMFIDPTRLESRVAPASKASVRFAGESILRLDGLEALAS
jgi:asparagine synthase (glutamine-hydrolysing)